MSERTLTCVITGESFTAGAGYYAKKISDYGTEEKLKKFYIKSKVKTLLKQNYTIAEIRKTLGSENPQTITEADIADLLAFHKITFKSTNKLNINTNLLQNKSDPDVEQFINKLLKK